ncbi:unnamed protein product [[Candida] boidinii]|nr:unnamed protein product [[Candida] boidinii]
MSSRESRKRRHVVDSDDEEGVESKKVKTENDDTYDENQDESETRTMRRKEDEDGDRDQQETEEDDFQLPDYYPLTSQVRTDIIRFSVDKEMMHLDRLVSDIQKELKDDILGFNHK